MPEWDLALLPDVNFIENHTLKFALAYIFISVILSIIGLSSMAIIGDVYF